MRVDVIRPVLRIILDHEHHGALPEWTLSQRLDDPAQREVVVSHIRAGRRLAGAPTSGVIVRQPNYLERGQISRSHELLKIFQPNIYPDLIRDIQIVSR